MCFSAPVSFLASGGLLAVGLATIKYPKTTGEKLLASFPFLFSIQQFLEGTLWMVLARKWPTGLEWIAMNGFLFFAFLVWPFYIPLTAHLLENNEKRKKWTGLFFIFGALLSISMFFGYIQIEKFASISNLHIDYCMPLIEQGLINLIEICYLVLVIGILLFSSRKRLKLTLTIGLISYFVAQFFYKQFFISVWCFFCTVNTLLIYFYFRFPNFLAQKKK